MSEQTKAKQPVFLLDASIYIFRYYFALPERWFSRDQQLSTAAVYGYTGFLLDLIAQQRPATMAACFDESLGSCFRNEIYAGYKASRALPDEALAFQLNACREVTELLGIRSFASEVYEADDLLGSLSAWLQGEPSLQQQPIIILSRDKDLGQLLSRAQDSLCYYTDAASLEAVSLYSADIEQKFGVRPEQLVGYLALVGDSIDDIPGVPGVGAKTASALLQHFGDFQNLFARLNELPSLSIRGAKTLGPKLREHYEQALMSRSLATIVTDIDLALTPAALRRQPIELEAFEEFCRRMGFASAFAKRLKLCM